jgi:hypothetical protein
MKLLLIASFSLLLFTSSLIAQETIDEINWSRFIPNDKVPALSTFSGVLTKNEKRTLALLTSKEKQLLQISPDQLAFANFAKYNPKNKKNENFVIVFPGITINTAKSIEQIDYVKKFWFDWNSISRYGFLEDSVLSYIGQAENNLKSVSFVKEHWAQGARPDTSELEVHALLKFEFYTSGALAKFAPRLIVNQSKVESGESIQKSLVPEADQIQNNLIISIEAIRPESDPAASFMPSSMKMDFGIAHLIYNYETRQETTRAEGGVYKEIPLKFKEVYENYRYQRVTSSPKMAILLEGFQRNLVLGRIETYNVFTKNCTNELFALLDGVLKYKSDYQFLKEDVKNFIKDDVPVLLELLADHPIEDKQLPKEVQNFLKATIGTTVVQQSMLTQYLSSLSAKIEAGSLTDSDIQFLSAWPPFIEGQLKSRKLMYEKN